MTIPNDKLTGFKDTGRCYIEFGFGENLATLIPDIANAVHDFTGIRPEIYVSGSNTLLVLSPLEDDNDDD